MQKPFDGAISEFYRNDFPARLREEIEQAKKDRILSESYPYDRRMPGKEYDRQHEALQIELVKLLSWVKETGARVAVLFEGRDAAGKGGAIKRLRENMNPRGARVVALGKPSDVERGQWYFQRYVEHLPAPGEIVFFDRSWYNRAVVERVFGFSTDAERRRFFRQVPDFEQMLVDDGIRLFKIWLTVSRTEQMRRFLARERDPLKQWKLSPIDLKSLGFWDAYTEAIRDMFDRTHLPHSPWNVIRADDKRRARLATQRVVLSAIDYAQKDENVVGRPDRAIVGSPEVMPIASG